MKLTDRRVKRTNQLLANALISLAQEKDFDSITIREIAQRADISYSTFFRHYTNKEELMLDLLQTIISEMRGVITQPPEIVGRLIFERVNENPVLYRVLLNSMRSNSINKHVRERVIAEIRNNQPQGNSQMIPPEIVANHLMVSILGLLEWWLENNMPYPPEEMGIFYYELIMKPVVNLKL